MIKKIILLCVLITTCSIPALAIELGGVTMPDSMQTDGRNLLLNGAGIRSKFFIKLYVGGLYLDAKSQDAANIIESDTAMTIRLHIISSAITSKKMESATREGFHNATQGNLEPVKEEIEQFIAVFKTPIKNNDVYDLTYTPGKGVDVYKNKTLHTTITGLPFKKALFGIWLGEKPAQKSLKQKMLAF